jgi:hypothetical protein
LTGTHEAAELAKQLNTFPAREAARGGMDADRLRAALALT